MRSETFKVIADLWLYRIAIGATKTNIGVEVFPKYYKITPKSTPNINASPSTQNKLLLITF